MQGKVGIATSSPARTDWPFGLDDDLQVSASLQRRVSLGPRSKRILQRRGLGHVLFVLVLLLSCGLLIGTTLTRFHRQRLHQAVQVAHSIAQATARTAAPIYHHGAAAVSSSAHSAWVAATGRSKSGGSTGTAAAEQYGAAVGIEQQGTHRFSSMAMPMRGGLAMTLQPLRARVGALWSSYNRALAAQPLVTKCCTGMVGAVLGDAVAQFSAHAIARPRKRQAGGRTGRHATSLVPDAAVFRYDWARLARLVTWSAVVATPIAHYWFNFLDKAIMPGAPTSPRAVILKLLLDQGVMAPLGTALFFAGMKVMEGAPECAVPEVRAKLWPVMCANWAVWPVANAINFAIIPPSQRVLYVNVLAVAWSAFMSHMASQTSSPAPMLTSEVPMRVLVGDGVAELAPGPSGSATYMMQPGAGKRRV